MSQIDPCPEWKEWDGERKRLASKWEAAKRKWNRDGGPIEKTVEAGEDLYFAADDLIEHLITEPFRQSQADAA